MPGCCLLANTRCHSAGGVRGDRAGDLYGGGAAYHQSSRMSTCPSTHLRPMTSSRFTRRHVKTATDSVGRQHCTGCRNCLLCPCLLPNCRAEGNHAMGYKTTVGVSSDQVLLCAKGLATSPTCRKTHPRAVGQLGGHSPVQSANTGWTCLYRNPG
jgi:hypothetical protein